MQPNEFKAFFNHIHCCNNAFTQQSYFPLQAKGQIIGWVDKEKIEILNQLDINFNSNHILSIPIHLGMIALGKKLIDQGYIQTMNELFDVYPSPYVKSIDQIDRSVLPFLGMIGTGVHLNGLVKKKDGIYLWVAQRAQTKRLDPGKFDHIVAGGIPAGYDHYRTLIKEAKEEANLPSELIQHADYKSVVSYSINRAEGLRRDILYCYDLWLPEDFCPSPNDGEVSQFILMPIDEVYQQVVQKDCFKFNVNLVLIDLFIRLKLISPNTEQGQLLKQGLCGKIFP